jgi:hypothetical protein
MNLIDESTAILCSGELKDSRGMVRKAVSATMCYFTYDYSLLKSAIFCASEEEN